MQPVHQAKTTGHGPRTTNKRGFTLVELLMVILIIAVLVSLLTVAVSSAMKNARIAEVKAEISSLEGALADFNASFGKFPPSSITLYEAAEDPATTAAESWDNSPRSKALIRSLWPQFNFAIARDLDNDGAMTSVFELNGSECLVFFLGGVREPKPPALRPPMYPGELLTIPIGFSKNPANPFALTGTNRLGPFLEFDAIRVTGIDLDGDRAPDGVTDKDGDAFPEYLDRLAGQTSPYIYLSSYDGSGYINAEAIASGLGSATVSGSGYYRQSSSTGWKNKTFQIISPGPDATAGLGGLFNPNNASSLAEGDRDNITNFHGSPLGSD